MRIEPNWKDEILQSEAKYRIKENGRTVVDNATIEQITPTLQVPTPLNKENLETTIGEIRTFVNQRDDTKYLRCDGARILKIDYPALAEILPERYEYEATSVDSTYGYITKMYYFESCKLYVMVRRGISDSKGFSIWTSPDISTWTLRYTSSNTYYSRPPAITYYPELKMYVGYDPKIIVASTDCINWFIAKSETTSSDYYYAPITYSSTLKKAILNRYKNSSTYYTYLYTTTDFVNYTTLFSKSGSSNEIMREKIIEQNGTLYSSGTYSTIGSTTNMPFYLWKSIDNGVSWTAELDKPMSTNNAIKFGNYWYTFYKTSSTTNPYRLFRTTNFETFQDIYVGTEVVSILGIINGYLYINYGAKLRKINTSGNVVASYDVQLNLGYLNLRKEFINIMSGRLFCSKDLINWYCYDNTGSTEKTNNFYYTSNNKIFVINSDSYTNRFYSYDENYINLPTIDNYYTYVKALDESEE